MMLANSFDLWRKDAFFSAAEEVQESADVMESTYRLWVRERREGRDPENLDELCREVQAALGTAKWQLEEFERAVRVSHGHCRDEATATRHKQFVAAIEDQISRIEAALEESCSEGGKQPLRWVNLNKEECDDLAMFLSGAFEISPGYKDDNSKPKPVKSVSAVNPDGRNEAVVYSKPASSADGSSESKRNDSSSECVIDIEEKRTSGRRDDRACQTDRTAGARRTLSTPNFGALRVVIPDQGEEKRNLLSGVEATPKEKGSRPFFRVKRCLQQSRCDSLFNQISGVLGGVQRRVQSPMQSQFSRSLQLALALMLMMFLLVPFVLHST